VGRSRGTDRRRGHAACLRLADGHAPELLESPDGEALTLSTNGGAQRVTLTQNRDTGIEIVSEGPLSITAKQDVQVVTTGGDVAVPAAPGSPSPRPVPSS
jgi:hypothetical protein